MRKLQRESTNNKMHESLAATILQMKMKETNVHMIAALTLQEQGVLCENRGGSRDFEKGGGRSMSATMVGRR